MKKICVLLIAAMLCFGTAICAYAAPAEGSGKMYGIGSVSKVFTAAAVMKLVDQGKIDLDEPVTVYIPEFELADQRYKNITVRMLLNHSSGIMGTTDKDSSLLGDNDTAYHDTFVQSLRAQRLKHNPGERSIYCNDGFTLAEILVECVSGTSFTEFIDREFSAPLGLENIKTSQSEFNRERLADVYIGTRALKPQNLGVIGTGGIYSTAEDVCRYATIFMDSADGSILSKSATDEMARNHHKMELVDENVDTMFRYGLGWDGVDGFPFSQYGIKSLSKGGNTGLYSANMTVLPEYNMAVAVISSGRSSHENIIAQEILLAVLAEEGLIPEYTEMAMPEINMNSAEIPQELKANAGMYDAGAFGGLMNIDFTENKLVMTPVAARNERPQEYLYNTDGVFVSTNGDYLGKLDDSAPYGISLLDFSDNYLIMQTYEDVPTMGQSAMAMPIAQKLEDNPIGDAAVDTWLKRNDKEFLLVSDKYTSLQYVESPIVKTLMDERLPGYAIPGFYRGPGRGFPTVKIIDADNANSFLITPTMPGRDGKDLAFITEGGVQYLDFNYGNYLYIDANAVEKFSEASDKIIIDDRTIWFDVDADSAGQIIHVDLPQNGSWFVYDNRMNCIATSLEKAANDRIILPDGGRVAFAGEPGAIFNLE